MIETKKFETKKNFGSNKSAKLWYKHCEKNGIPYVIISVGNHYANIDWDSLTTQEKACAKLGENNLQIKETILMLCEKYRHRNFHFMFSSLFGCLANIRIEDAQSVAAMVFDTINANT